MLRIRKTAQGGNFGEEGRWLVGGDLWGFEGLGRLGSVTAGARMPRGGASLFGRGDGRSWRGRGAWKECADLVWPSQPQRTAENRLCESKRKCLRHKPRETGENSTHCRSIPYVISDI